MKAVVWTKYGPPDVLRIEEVEKPIPKDNEILIKIYATTVSAGDCEMRSLNFPRLLRLLIRLAVGFRRPKKKRSIPGQELAGEIEAVGNEVTLFKKGDQVFANTGFHFGAYAEYVCLPEDPKDGMVSIKPTNITYEEAAAISFGGHEAVHFLRKANIQKGQKVLIRGASGSIGTFGIQLAKYYGAEVTGIGNPTSLEMMKSIGADKVIDYTKEDFTQNGETYDVIFDMIGKSSFLSRLSSLKENGFYLLANPKITLYNRDKRDSRRNSKYLISGLMDTNSERNEDLDYLKELVESGKLKAVIDKRYPLEKIVEAHRYVDKGQKTGNVAITLENYNKT